jgi:hypothetical protein
MRQNAGNSIQFICWELLLFHDFMKKVLYNHVSYKSRRLGCWYYVDLGMVTRRELPTA